MRTNGIEVEAIGQKKIIAREILSEKTPSWAAMLEFCKRHPTGHEPEWDAFVKRHTAMQRRESDSALRQYMASRQ